MKEYGKLMADIRSCPRESKADPNLVISGGTKQERWCSVEVYEGTNAHGA